MSQKSGKSGAMVAESPKPRKSQLLGVRLEDVLLDLINSLPYDERKGYVRRLIIEDLGERGMLKRADRARLSE